MSYKLEGVKEGGIVFDFYNFVVSYCIYSKCYWNVFVLNGLFINVYLFI